MQQENRDKVKFLIDGLHKQANDIADFLGDDPEVQSVKTVTTQTLKQLAMRFSGMIGYIEAGGDVAQQQEEFPPITKMMGMDISDRKPVEATEINPDEEAKNIFLKKRDDLYSRFPEMTDEQVIASMTEPEGQSLIRSVAKKAGIEDFREAPLNVEFFAAIRQGIAAKKEVADAQNTVDTAVNANMANASEDIDESLNAQKQALDNTDQTTAGDIPTSEATEEQKRDLEALKENETKEPTRRGRRPNSQNNQE